MKRPACCVSLTLILCAVLGTGCASRTPRPDSHADRYAGPGVLRAQTSPGVSPVVSGTLGPEFAATSADIGFGRYDSAVQSSLFLCLGLGPAAAPCMAVMGGLTAVGGAADTLGHEAARRDTSLAETDNARADLDAGPSLLQLAERVVAQATAQGAAAGLSLVAAAPVADAPCATPVDDRLPAWHLDLAIVEMRVTFEAGYRFRLDLIARARAGDCAAQAAERERRLAYLGAARVLPRAAAARTATIEDEISRATEALGTDVIAYLQDRR